MFKNKIVFFMMLCFLLTSCESVREGLTGAKNQSEITSFEKTLNTQTMTESSSATEDSVEGSILNQIRKR